MWETHFYQNILCVFYTWAELIIPMNRLFCFVFLARLPESLSIWGCLKFLRCHKWILQLDRALHCATTVHITEKITEYTQFLCGFLKQQKTPSFCHPCPPSLPPQLVVFLDVWFTRYRLAGSIVKLEFKEKRLFQYDMFVLSSPPIRWSIYS